MATYPLNPRRVIPIRTTVHGFISQPAAIGRIPREKLGACINTVARHPFPCPAHDCDMVGPIEVYSEAVRWPCGHTRSLPKLNIDCYAGCCHRRTRRPQLAA